MEHGRNSQASVNDVSFVSALIDHIQQTRNIDSRKIYATGFSRGAILAQTLACQIPDKIAAFASVAYRFQFNSQSSCQPPTPVSMLMINGTKDLEVHYQGITKSTRRAGFYPGDSELLAIARRMHFTCSRLTTS